MTGTLLSAAIRRMRSAWRSAWSRDSITHGPAISAKGAPPPKVTLPTRTALVLGTGAPEGCDMGTDLRRRWRGDPRALASRQAFREKDHHADLPPGPAHRRLGLPGAVPAGRAGGSGDPVRGHVAPGPGSR